MNISVVHGPVLAPKRVVVDGGAGDFHFFEGGIAVDHRLDAVANDDQHIAVLSDCKFVAQRASARRECDTYP